MTVGQIASPWNDGKLFRLSRKHQLDCFNPASFRSDDFVESTCFSTCGKHLIAATTNGSIRTYETDRYYLYNIINLNLRVYNEFKLLKRAYFQSHNSNKVIVITENDFLQRLNIFDVGTGNYHLLNISNEFKDCNFTNIDCLPNDTWCMSNETKEVGHFDMRTNTSYVVGVHENSKFCRLYMSECDPTLFTIVDSNRKRIVQYDYRMFGFPVASMEVPLSQIKCTAFDKNGSKLAVLGANNDIWSFDTRSLSAEGWCQSSFITSPHKIRPLYFLDAQYLVCSEQNYTPTPSFFDVAVSYAGCEVKSMKVYNLSTNSVVKTINLCEPMKVTTGVDHRVCCNKSDLVVGPHHQVEVYGATNKLAAGSSSCAMNDKLRTRF